MDENNPLFIISKVRDFVEVYEFLEKDKDVKDALELVIKSISNPGRVPPEKAASLVMQMQGYSAKFAIQAAIYTTLKKDRAGTEFNMRKNIYYTLAEQMDKLAAAMKIVAKL